MKKDSSINDVLKNFGIYSVIEKYGNGIINDTYLVKQKEFIVQRINTNVFKNPDELMENIYNVTSFLKEKIIQNGGDPQRETLTVIKTIDGKNYYRSKTGDCFRVYNFIKDTKTIEISSSAQDMYNAGKGFGKFVSMLNDFPVGKLHETIKDFHHTPKRVEALKNAINEDIKDRVKLCEDDIEFALKTAQIADRVTNELEAGNLPVRVVHNDTKINNLLFDSKTGEPICVIDLDTVMPGSLLYDFGDALRIGASSAPEDEVDLDKVYFNTDLFKGFAKGYLESAMDKLTKKEVELLAFSAKLITYECGIRFLTDFLNGDTYFKTTRENHNIDRARNQFKIVRDIDNKMDELNRIIEELYIK